MRRLFSRKSVDDTKCVKEDGKEGKTKKSLFGRSHGAKKDDAPHQGPSKSQQQQAPNQQDSTTNSSASSASSAVSIPLSTPYFPTPSGSSSSFSSVMSCNESPSPVSDLTALSTTPSSTLSRPLGSNTSITSLNPPPPHPGFLAVPSPSSIPASGPQISHTEQRKPLSPLSVVVDLHSVHTPPPSDDEEDNLQPKRRNSIYNIFRKSQSQPNLNSGPSSRSSSITTLPSAYNAPQGSGATLTPPSALNNHRRSMKFLRRKSSNNSLEEVVDGEGILSRNEATARRAILQGDLLGGGAYLYPMGLASKSNLMHKPPSQQQGSRNRRGAVGTISVPRRSTWGGPSSHGHGGMAWRAPHIGGRNGGKMTIEEENDMMEQHQQHQREMGAVPGGFIEDTPQFQRPQQQRPRPPMNRRPTSSQSGRANPSGYGYFNGNDSTPSGYHPTFARPRMLPVINQQTAQSAQV
ncbi:hypothetical protein EV426DRAFT_436987 [Tirmania nivea]|nr:hypothetical protein EV426DRAFT_436987 [Tirmania nivea]